MLKKCNIQDGLIKDSHLVNKFLRVNDKSTDSIESNISAMMDYHHQNFLVNVLLTYDIFKEK